MTIVSNMPKTVRIEGVDFDPRKGGVKVPDEKIKALESNMFFKHYVSTKEFSIMGAQKVEEAPKQTESKKGN